MKELERYKIPWRAMIVAHLYRGRSQHPVFHTWERELYVVELSSGILQLPWWNRLWKRQPSLLEPFVDFTWRLGSLERGQRILAEVKPEGGYLDFARLEEYRAWLDEQVRLSSNVGLKTSRSSENAKWPDSVFCKQYLFEVSDQGQLVSLFDLFRNFDMLDILIFHVDADLRECARQLQKGVLDQPFDLECIVESLNAFVYSNWLGDRLIVETPKENLIEDLLKTLHIEPVLIPHHPLAKQPSRSLWLGKRRVFP